MDVDVLGPLEARIWGKSVTPTAAKARKVLAVLAVRANQVVPVAALIEELWGQDVPRSATTTLQTYVMHLRGLIGAALEHSPPGAVRNPKQVLLTQSGGYLLVAEPDAVDVKTFERLAEAGHRACQAGDYQRAAREFHAALANWRGDALVDVQVGTVLEVEARRLEEARLSVLDRRIDADLRLGRHHELLGELTGLVARHRTHESLYAHLMVALYRSGRRGDAANVYRRLHTCLVDEFGLDPSPALHGLQRRILSSDPRLLFPADEHRLEQVG
ncbi:AfsR/SARP family transcriptional regulator [Actinokineospora sp.]|uniref:AfsR/SARP family transcriptional regulator n=1 Tax=Actinokineospora sp. TaxID=1872133 RepID=UPI004037D76E